MKTLYLPYITIDVYNFKELNKEDKLRIISKFKTHRMFFEYYNSNLRKFIKNYLNKFYFSSVGRQICKMNEIYNISFRRFLKGEGKIY